MCDYVKLQWHLKNAFAGIRLTSCQTTLKSLDGTNFYYFNVFRLQLYNGSYRIVRSSLVTFYFLKCFLLFAFMYLCVKYCPTNSTRRIGKMFVCLNCNSKLFNWNNFPKIIKLEYININIYIYINTQTYFVVVFVWFILQELRADVSINSLKHLNATN